MTSVIGAGENSKCPLNMTGDWEQQVNGRAKRTDDQLEMEKKFWAEETARQKAQTRANRAMYGFCFGLLLIVAGGCCLNYVNGIPQWVSIAISIVGVAAFYFTLGWIFGHKCRR